MIAGVEEEGVGVLGDLVLLGERSEVFGRAHKSVVDDDVPLSAEAMLERTESNAVVQFSDGQLHARAGFDNCF